MPAPQVIETDVFQHVDLAETRRRAAVTDDADLTGLTLAVDDDPFS